VELPKSFCWSKLGTEAGQTVQAILWRKEVERRLGSGVFLWGVGNSLGTGLAELRRHRELVTAVFSVMRSNAKPADRHPVKVLVWLSYFDGNGREVPLPSHCLVTSRGTTESGRGKHSHYALICRSANSLLGRELGYLDAARLRNVKSGRTLGFSQVTAAVSHEERPAGPSRHYPVTFLADLEEPGQVRLARAVPIERAVLDRLYLRGPTVEESEWLDCIRQLKGESR
jgi:hypothetical protein